MKPAGISHLLGGGGGRIVRLSPAAGAEKATMDVPYPSTVEWGEGRVGIPFTQGVRRPLAFSFAESMVDLPKVIFRGEKGAVSKMGKRGGEKSTCLSSRRLENRLAGARVGLRAKEKRGEKKKEHSYDIFRTRGEKGKSME